MVDLQKLATEFVEGDQRPDLVMTLKGTDLTGYTVILRIRRPAPAAVLEKPAIEIDYQAAFSKFKFVWDAGDLVGGCDQLCEVQFTDTLGKALTSRRFLIDVQPAIA
jgi:hypothetical protein